MVESSTAAAPLLRSIDIICFSHLRWGFVFQRPQHLMSRFAACGRVYFWEEPVVSNGSAASQPSLNLSRCPKTDVYIATPVMPANLSSTEIAAAQRCLLEGLLAEHRLQQFVAWYYTPMALEFTGSIHPLVTIYDCMDELSAFQGAPPSMLANERRLFAAADLVFTGGASLYKSKRTQHSAVYSFPSSVDQTHFAAARIPQPEPDDQKLIGQYRIGYAGVIDERMNLALLRDIAVARPDWHFVMIGPVVKIDPAQLPQAPNIHYLGMKPYSELPAYFSGWKIGMLPFALNESTRYISPTKTPEYLAAGLRVVSTPITDVVHPYGDLGLADIAATAPDFVAAIERLVNHSAQAEFDQVVETMLRSTGWDKTWAAMEDLIAARLSVNSSQSASKTQEPAATQIA